MKDSTPSFAFVFRQNMVSVRLSVECINDSTPWLAVPVQSSRPELWPCLRIRALCFLGRAPILTRPPSLLLPCGMLLDVVRCFVLLMNARPRDDDGARPKYGANRIVRPQAEASELGATVEKSIYIYILSLIHI